MTSVPTDRAPRWAVRLFAAMTLTMALCVVAVLFHPLSDTATEAAPALTGLVVFFGATVLCAIRARSTPHERVEWSLFAVALSLWASGSAYYMIALTDRESIPVPSLSDALWIAFYVPVYVAIFRLLRQRAGSFGRVAWLDALVGVIGVGGAAALMVFGTVLEETSGTALGTVTTLASPIGDLGLVALLVAAMTMLGWRNSGAFRWIAPAFFLFAVADSAYLVEAAKGTYEVGTILDLGWPLAAFLVGLGALRPDSPPPTDARTRPVVGVPETVGVAAVVLLIVDHFHPASATAVILAGASLIVILLRLYLTVRENQRLLRTSTREAMTDALTGLGNRRQLAADLERHMDGLAAGRPLVLTLFDLDGFKHYNDTFGHPAGDQLLTRLGASLSGLVSGFGAAYRMGGDEFCTLWSTWDANIADVSPADAAAALSENGEAFAIGCSYGSVSLPAEAADPSDALRLADSRMYEEKNSGRMSAGRQSADVLQRALIERDSVLADHAGGVADLAAATAARLRAGKDEQELTAQVALLHDIGKVAIPDAVLKKPGALDRAEWAFMTQHTVIGERILSAAPALAGVARLVRSTHEAFDGQGYPDGLAGEDIPLIARIVSVCDAYRRDDRAAQLPDRPVRRRGAGRAAPLCRDAVRPPRGRGLRLRARGPGRPRSPRSSPRASRSARRCSRCRP